LTDSPHRQQCVCENALNSGEPSLNETILSQGLVCKSCGIITNNYDVYRKMCRPCSNAYYADYRKRNNEKSNAYLRKWRAKNKKHLSNYLSQRRKNKLASMSPEEQKVFRKIESDRKSSYLAKLKNEIFKAYGGWVCACCGETERAFLTIDHIHNNGNQMKKAGVHDRRPQPFYRWLKKNNYPEGFQILCMNCNFGKMMNNGTCPHKTRCNDHPIVGVGSSDPKRSAPIMIMGDDMICSVQQCTAALG
jgi:hypothetical protein